MSLEFISCSCPNYFLNFYMFLTDSGGQSSRTVREDGCWASSTTCRDLADDVEYFVTVKANIQNDVKASSSTTARTLERSTYMYLASFHRCRTSVMCLFSQIKKYMSDSSVYFLMNRLLFAAASPGIMAASIVTLCVLLLLIIALPG